MAEIEDNMAVNHARLREARIILQKVEPCPGLTEEEIREIEWIALRLLRLMARIKLAKITTKLPLAKPRSRKQKPNKTSGGKH